MKNYDYYCIRTLSDPKLGRIENIDKRVKKSYNLRKGIPMGNLFPPETKLDIADTPGSGDMLADFLRNIHRSIIISSKVKDILMEEGVDETQVEYLPFILRDKKRRVIKDVRYYVANSLVKVDCMDKENSIYKPDFDDPEKARRISALHVNHDAIPEDAKFFRLGELSRLTLIRSDLLERLKAEGVTGINAFAMGDELP